MEVGPPRELLLRDTDTQVLPAYANGPAKPPLKIGSDVHGDLFKALRIGHLPTKKLENDG